MDTGYLQIIQRVDANSGAGEIYLFSRGFSFSGDGNYLFSSSPEVWIDGVGYASTLTGFARRELSTPFDLSTMSAPVSVRGPLVAGGGKVLTVQNNGSDLVYCDTTYGRLYHAQLSVPYDLTSMVYSDHKTTLLGDYGISFSEDGLSCVTCSSFGEQFKSHTLSAPFVVSGMTSSPAVSGLTNGLESLFFMSKNGSRLYVFGSVPDVGPRFIICDLASPWDVSAMTIREVFSLPEEIYDYCWPLGVFVDDEESFVIASAKTDSTGSATRLYKFSINRPKGQFWTNFAGQSEIL